MVKKRKNKTKTKTRAKDVSFAWSHQRISSKVNKTNKTRPTLTVFQFFFFFKFVNVKHVSDVYGHDQRGSFCVSRIDQEASRFSYESEVFEL